MSWIAVTASPSAKPGARLNEIVTAGCWPWWLTSSGPTDGTGMVTADSGIDCPDGMPLPVMPPPGPAPRCRRRRDGAAAVGLDEDVLQARRIGPELRLGLQDHLVVVARRVDRRDLAVAEGVEQLLADLVDGDAVDRRLLAIDLDHHLRVGDVEIGGDVEQARRPWQSCRAIPARACRACRCRSIAACTGYWLLLIRPPTLMFWIIWKNTVMPVTALAARRMRRNDFAQGPALVLGLERHQHAAVVERGIGAADADGRVDVEHRRIGAHDLGDLALALGPWRRTKCPTAPR